MITYDESSCYDEVQIPMINSIFKNFNKELDATHKISNLIFQNINFDESSNKLISSNINKSNYEFIEASQNADDFSNASELFRQIHSSEINSITYNNLDELIEYASIFSSGKSSLNSINDYYEKISQLKKNIIAQIIKDVNRSDTFINNVYIGRTKQTDSDSNNSCEQLKKIKNEIIKNFENYGIDDVNGYYLYVFLLFTCQSFYNGLLGEINANINQLVKSKYQVGLNIKRQDPDLIFPANRIIIIDDKNNITFNSIIYLRAFIIDKYGEFSDVGYIKIFISFDLVKKTIKICYDLMIDFNDELDEIPIDENNTNNNNKNNKYKVLNEQDKNILNNAMKNKKELAAAGSAFGLVALSAIPLALLLGGKSKKNKQKRTRHRKYKKCNYCNYCKKYKTNKRKKYRKNKYTHKYYKK